MEARVRLEIVVENRQSGSRQMELELGSEAAKSEIDDVVVVVDSREHTSHWLLVVNPDPCSSSSLTSHRIV